LLHVHDTWIPFSLSVWREHMCSGPRGQMAELHVVRLAGKHTR